MLIVYTYNNWRMINNFNEDEVYYHILHEDNSEEFWELNRTEALQKQREMNYYEKEFHKMHLKGIFKETSIAEYYFKHKYPSSIYICIESVKELLKMTKIRLISQKFGI